jgi:hypothetical protein
MYALQFVVSRLVLERYLIPACVCKESYIGLPNNIEIIIIVGLCIRILDTFVQGIQLIIRVPD